MSTAQQGQDTAELGRLIDVVARLRRECPWDAEQTHRSLVPYLLEESYEVVEAIETLPAPDHDHLDGHRHDHLVEELGDLLLQVLFHVVVAAEDDPEVTTARVAAGIADKLVARHPHVFAGDPVGSEVSLDELNATWEARKAVEKNRRSVLDGIPDLPALARATKIINRSRARGVPVAPFAPSTVGEQILTLVADAHAAGVDPDQSLRDAVRGLEERVRAAESR
jgi:XTP/dITP diphosphohydrolase